MDQIPIVKKVAYFSGEDPLEVIAPAFIFLDIENKLSPFINLYQTNNQEITLSIQCFNEPAAESQVQKAKKGDEVIIDASLYKESSSNGRRYDLNEFEYLILVEKTNSLFDFNKKNKSIKVYNSDKEALSKDTIRLIKSLISLQCEANNAVMLHASGIVVGEKDAVLLLGDSRNGKTTILLEALTKFEGSMLSCDTSIIHKKDDKVIARGWPSNFSVSFGTMHDYEVLYKFLTGDKASLSYTQAWDIYDKHVLDAKEVVKSMATEFNPEAIVKTLIFLNFNPAAKTGIRQLLNKDEVAGWIKKVYLGSIDHLYPNWHKYIEISVQQIERNISSFVDSLYDNTIDVYEMNWAPSPESLLRRVSTLEPFNINMKRRRNEI